MVWLGDVDGDSVADFAIADPSYAGGGTLFGSGMVSVISGGDGSLIRTHEGAPAGGQYFGIALASMDADRDGVPDLVVGASGHGGPGPFAGAVWTFSGADGSVIGFAEGEPWSEYGAAVAPAGDQDGDGVEDLFVGVPRAASSRGQVVVQSGADGSLLSTFTSPGIAGSFGVAVAGIGDIDGDGRMDPAVGEPGHSGSAPFGGRVIIFRSSDGGVAGTRDGVSYAARLGSFLEAIPDVDGDGGLDLMIGSYAGGECLVISGDDASVIEDLSLPGLSPFQPLVPAGAMDLNGDGSTDWIIGSPGFRVVDFVAYGGIRAVSGADGSTLFEVEAEASWSGLGQYLALGPEGLLAAEPTRMDASGGGRGYIHLYRIGSNDSDGDGIPDDQDSVPDSIVDPTVVVGGVDSGVQNWVDDTGRTLADIYAELGDPTAIDEPGAYVSAFSRLTNDLRRAGAISKSEAKALHAAGVRAASPSKGSRR